MGDPAMELTQSQLQQIADYVKSQIPDWVYRTEPPNQQLQERMLGIEEQIKALWERMLAVEHELKAQREVMATRFEAVDQRFEQIQLQMDRRFESVDKRFSTLQWMWGGGVLLITVLMSVYQFVS